MLIKRPSDISSSEITPESVYLKRRAFLEKVGLGGVGVAALAFASRTPVLGRVGAMFAASTYR